MSKVMVRLVNENGACIKQLDVTEDFEGLVLDVDIGFNCYILTKWLGRFYKHYLEMFGKRKGTLVMELLSEKGCLIGGTGYIVGPNRLEYNGPKTIIDIKKLTTDNFVGFRFIKPQEN